MSFHDAHFVGKRIHRNDSTNPEVGEYSRNAAWKLQKSQHVKQKPTNNHISKKSPTVGPIEQSPQPEYPISRSQLTERGLLVRPQSIFDRIYKVSGKKQKQQPKNWNHSKTKHISQKNESMNCLKDLGLGTWRKRRDSYNSPMIQGDQSNPTWKAIPVVRINPHL